MINWLMNRTYKQTALLMSGFLSVCLMLGGLAVVTFGDPHPSITYWDAIWPSICIFIMSIIGFAIMPIIWPSDKSNKEK
jgi:hypothetical protein